MDRDFGNWTTITDSPSPQHLSFRSGPRRAHRFFFVVVVVAVVIVVVVVACLRCVPPTTTTCATFLLLYFQRPERSAAVSLDLRSVGVVAFLINVGVQCGMFGIINALWHGTNDMGALPITTPARSGDWRC